MFLLLLGLVVVYSHTHGNAEVLLNTFGNKDCSHFFFNGQEPKHLEPLSYAHICQWYKGRYRFATLYDREKHIPIYSAYRYIYKNPVADWLMKPYKGWFIEPQLVDRSKSKAMIPEIDTNIDRAQLKNSQAVTEDYKNTSVKYDRGHLNPRMHNPHPDDSNATFTLTNIVPQNKTLNQGAWVEYEKSMEERAKPCAETYVIVGVVPGQHFIPSDNNKRVNIPSHIWAATCCKLKRTKRMHSWAVIAENGNNAVHNISVGALEKKISSLMERPVCLFHDDCPK